MPTIRAQHQPPAGYVYLNTTTVDPTKQHAVCCVCDEVVTDIAWWEPDTIFLLGTPAFRRPWLILKPCGHSVEDVRDPTSGPLCVVTRVDRLYPQDYQYLLDLVNAAAPSDRDILRRRILSQRAAFDQVHGKRR